MKRATDKLHADHKAMIHAVAYQAQSALIVDEGIHQELEELVSQGNLIFCEAAKTYKKDRKAKFGTWLNFLLVQKLYNFGITQSALTQYPKSIRPDDWAVIDDMQPGEPPTGETFLDFRYKKKSLSLDARKIVKLFTDYPIEVLGLDGSEPPRKVRGQLRLYLRTVGWSHPRINRTLKELRQAFSHNAQA